MISDWKQGAASLFGFGTDNIFQLCTTAPPERDEACDDEYDLIQQCPAFETTHALRSSLADSKQPEPVMHAVQLADSDAEGVVTTIDFNQPEPGMQAGENITRPTLLEGKAAGAICDVSKDLGPSKMGNSGKPFVPRLKLPVSEFAAKDPLAETSAGKQLVQPAAGKPLVPRLKLPVSEFAAKDPLAKTSAGKQLVQPAGQTPSTASSAHTGIPPPSVSGMSSLSSYCKDSPASQLLGPPSKAFGPGQAERVKGRRHPSVPPLKLPISAPASALPAGVAKKGHPAEPPLKLPISDPASALPPGVAKTGFNRPVVPKLKLPVQ